MLRLTVSIIIVIIIIIIMKCTIIPVVIGATGIVTRSLTLRLLMSYIYMEHLFLMFLDHTRRRSTVGRTPLDE